MGTPSYMAPGQLAGNRVDRCADLFSLGVTMYELVTGQKPFAVSLATLRYGIANEPHPPMLSRCGATTSSTKALSQDSGKRCQRGAHVAADIRALDKEVQASRVRP